MAAKRVILYSLILILAVCTISNSAFFPQKSAGVDKNQNSTKSMSRGNSGGLSEGNEKDIIDIKPLEKIERDYRKILLVAAVIIILISIAILAYFYFKRRKKKAEAPVFIPPHKLALKEFIQLKEKKLLENGEYRKFYFAFSEIFRRYLERRFSFPAIEQTSEEIIPLLEKTGIFQESHFLLGRDFLLATDLVKFAKHFPMKEEIERIEEEFFKFIEGTKEKVEAENPKS